MDRSSHSGGFHVFFLNQLRATPWWAASLVFHGTLLSLLWTIAPAAPPPEPPALIAWRMEDPLVLLEPEVGPEICETAPTPFAVPEVVVDVAEETELLGTGGGAFPVAPFLGPATNAAVGIGGGAGGAFGGSGGNLGLCTTSCGGWADELLVVEWNPQAADRPPEFRGRPVTEGALLAFDEDEAELGAFPLLRTDVRAEVTAFLASVGVTQHYSNPFEEKVEAVYVFPLPVSAAVTDFEMTVGDRVIRGVVREREEARRIYEEAKRKGFVASLLTQERANVFTQRVANLEPGRTVDVEIRYFHPLRLRDGWLEFVFPTVVGPRYFPGGARGGPDSGTGWAADTDQVPDASRVSPPVALPTWRPGRTLSLEVVLDGGVPIAEIQCPTHDVEIADLSESRREVRLADRTTLPNRDFVLRYRLAGERPAAALLAHRGAAGGFFALVLAPPAAEETARVPREMVFVLDASGSMAGDPIEKSKAVVRRCLADLHPADTFRLIRFSEGASELAREPRPATPAEIGDALRWLDGISGEGGTEMIQGIRAALSPSVEPGRVRIVCFLTDGFIGNEDRILGEVRTLRAGARLFSFGVGSSVNRYLLDGLASQGRGAVQYVLPGTPAEEAAAEFARRTAGPCLAELEIDFGGIPVREVHPSSVPDLFPGMPALLVGRYEGGGPTVVTLRGRSGNSAFRAEFHVEFPVWEEDHEVLAPVWARSRIAEMLRAEIGGVTLRTKEEVTRLALEYRLLCPFTAFVAVDGSRETDGEGGLVVNVPVLLPDGVTYSGVFGERGDWFELRALGLKMAAEPGGLRVTDVRAGSPAEAAGLLAGDLVRGMNGRRVSTGLEAAAAARQSDEGIRVEVLRDGLRITASFTRTSLR